MEIIEDIMDLVLDQENDDGIMNDKLIESRFTEIRKKVFVKEKV